MSKQKSDSIQPTQVEPIRTSRRKLTAAALASPVILGTLVSKQALGVPYDCTISGKLSNNQSSHGGIDDCMIGKSHGYWKTHSGDWIYGFSQTDPFTKLLTGIGQFSNQYPKADGSSKSFGEVLDLGGGAGSAPYEALGREAVCALLNALKYGLNFPLTPQQVVTIFNTTVSVGQYIPQLGADPWSPEVVKNYFKSLHD